jgi:hypothetical protein
LRLTRQPGQAERALFQPPDNAAKRKPGQQRQGQADPGEQFQPSPRLTCDPAHSFPRLP